MIPTPPPGQGPIDPRGAFAPPGSGQGAPPQQQQPFRGMPNPQMPPGQFPPGQFPPGQFPPGQIPPWMMMPPQGFYPPPAAPRGGGFVRGIFVTLATTILGISLLLNVWLLIAVGVTGGSATSLQQTVLVEGLSTQKIAVVPINGVITGATCEHFKDIIRELRKDSTIKGLILQIDTPGGEVAASDEIYDLVNRYKADKGIKVVVSMGSMATSGGYYIACSSDFIIAQPTTLTGNIGVILSSFNFSGLMEKYGVKETSVTPVGSKYKNAGSPYKPESPEATAYLSGIAEDMFTRFKFVVSGARSTQLKAANQTIETVTDGRAFPATEAKRLGLIDDIGYDDAAFSKAKALAGTANAQIVKYQRSPGFLESLGGGGSASSSISPASLAGAKPDVSVRLDSQSIDELSSPKPQYLYRGGSGR